MCVCVCGVVCMCGVCVCECVCVCKFQALLLIFCARLRNFLLASTSSLTSSLRT